MTIADRDGESYKLELFRRLPRGPIWPTVGTEATVWDALFDTMAEEFARVWLSSVDWLSDFYPDTCTDQLADWERVLSLPDCGLALGSVAERRGAIIARLRRRGDPTLANIQALADSFDQGAVVTAGGTSDLFYVDGVTAVDGVNDVPDTSVAFTVLVTYDSPQSDTLECALTHAIPIHLAVTFLVI